MTDVYTQENASKKKFLAPVLVILLCMVSLTAAGYAYSATVDNTGDDIIVKGVTMTLYDEDTEVVTANAMYLVNDINLASHTTNGRAIWYAGGTGFIADAAVDFVPGTSVITDYQTGYYVEVLKGTTERVFYNPAAEPAYTAATIVTTAAADSPANHGVYQIGNGDVDFYTLNVDNQSGTTVDVKVTIDGIADVLAAAFIKNVYLLVDDGTTPVLKTVTTGEITLLEDLANGSTKDLTLTMYIELSDYRAATAAEILDDTDFKFNLSFNAYA